MNSDCVGFENGSVLGIFVNPVLLCACVWCTMKLCVFAGLWVRSMCVFLLVVLQFVFIGPESRVRVCYRA